MPRGLRDSNASDELKDKRRTKLMPYTSYFSDAQSVSTRWGLSLNQAQTVCEIWDLVHTELNTTYPNAMTAEAEGYFKQKSTEYDAASTKSSYKSWDMEISEAHFKKLVDIQRALMLLRGLYTGGLKQKAQVNYKMIWQPVKGKMGGDADEAEKLAKKFNDKYCPDEQRHYVHYLMKSKKEPSSMKPLVFEHNGNLNLRAWYRNSA